MRVGITASRKGITFEQRVALSAMLVLEHATELHHGDCVGGDAEADKIARELGLHIVGHPPLNEKLRAFCLDEAKGDKIRPAKDYHDRNHDIVNESDHLVGLPDGMHEKGRSGTWSTIRYARRVHKDYTIIYPDGTTTRRQHA